MIEHPQGSSRYDTQEKRQRHRDAQARYRKAHEDRVRATAAKYRENNREKYNESRKRWRDANPEKVREIDKRWDANNQDKRRSWRKRFRDEFRDELNRKHAIYKKFRLSVNREKNGKDLFATIMAAMPKGLPAHIRDDVVGTVALQVIDQKADVRKIKALVKAALTATWGQSDWFKHISIDASLTDDFTLLDTLTSEQQTPEEALTRRR